MILRYVIINQFYFSRISYIVHCLFNIGDRDRLHRGHGHVSVINELTESNNNVHTTRTRAVARAADLFAV